MRLLLAASLAAAAVPAAAQTAPSRDAQLSAFFSRLVGRWTLEKIEPAASGTETMVVERLDARSWMIAGGRCDAAGKCAQYQDSFKIMGGDLRDEQDELLSVTAVAADKLAIREVDERGSVRLVEWRFLADGRLVRTSSLELNGVVRQGPVARTYKKS